MQFTKPETRPWAVTLLELLVVVLIISILATIATGVYTGETTRARTAATRDLIRQLEVAITRYEVDLGQLPPTGSGIAVPPVTARKNGSGYLHLVLVHSMSGNAAQPASSLWQGPYINLTAAELNPADTNPASSDIIDAWGLPLFYVESSYYTQGDGGITFDGGTQVFSSTAVPFDVNTNLPAPNPFFATGETYYNPDTYQIISFGADGITEAVPFQGTERDDVTNFGY